jgi:predicted transcriptional regulator
MVDKKSSVIHDTEWDLLEALWQAERGTARNVTDLLLEKRGWAVSTVKTMLDRMVVKGLVSARQVGPVWEYTPAVKRTVARRSAWRALVDKAFGGAQQQALHFIASETKLSKKERAELRALLDAQEKGGDHE